MNRVLRFRAWDKKRRGMLDTPLRVMDLMHYGSEDELEIMQFTGLTDKNGREIYSGDIIRFTNEEADHTPIEVPEMTPDNWETLTGFMDGEWDCGNNRYSNIEVIGNIYENEELLDKTEEGER